jgi:hypothetical protein
MSVILTLLFAAFYLMVFGSFVLKQYQEKSLTHAITFVLLPVSFVIGLEAFLGLGSREPIYGMDRVDCLFWCGSVFVVCLIRRWAKNHEFEMRDERERERTEAERLAVYHDQIADLAARAGDDSAHRLEMSLTQYYVARARFLETSRPAPKPPRKSLRSRFSETLDWFKTEAGIRVGRRAYFALVGGTLLTLVVIGYRNGTIQGALRDPTFISNIADLIKLVAIVGSLIGGLVLLNVAADWLKRN